MTIRHICKYGRNLSNAMKALLQCCSISSAVFAVLIAMPHSAHAAATSPYALMRRMPEPSCSMNFKPVTAFVGEKSVLTWIAYNSLRQSINQGIGTVNSQSQTTIIVPLNARTYIMTVYGKDGSVVTCSARIEASPT